MAGAGHDRERQEIVRRTSLSFLVLAAGTFWIAAASPALQMQNQDELDRVSELILVHRYRQAEAILDSLERLYPERAGIRLQKVVLYYTWLDDYAITDSLGGRFLAEIDTTIILGDRGIDEDPSDKWAWFFKGSAHAYRAFYRSYTEGINLVTIRGLIADANTGIDCLQRAARIDTAFTDPLIGIGKYLHWKSKKLPWPLASSKDGERGIRMLEEAVRRGVIADGGAVQTLGWVYMAEHRYDDAIALVQPWMDRYPASRFFAEIIARAYQEKGDYPRAEQLFNRILDGLSPTERASNFIVMKYERWIARLRYQRGDMAQACQIAKRLRLLDYSGVNRDWVSRRIGEADKVFREACLP